MFLDLLWLIVLIVGQDDSHMAANVRVDNIQRGIRQLDSVGRAFLPVRCLQLSRYHARAMADLAAPGLNPS